MMHDAHSFLVPSYQESPYLVDCLRSIRNQSTRSQIVISTSTPFRGIEALAEQFEASLYIHSPSGGIVSDWNRGLTRITTEWVTLAHQDDVYLPRYTELVMNRVKSVRDATLVFTDYEEIGIQGELRPLSPLLKIKQILLQTGFLGRSSISDRFSKLNLLRFGSPIPCPSVTLRLQGRDPIFEQGFRLNMDWAAWIALAKQSGSFVWVKETLMQHRIHEQSETTQGISSGIRHKEDIAILTRLWPKPIARLIAKTYGLAYRSNA